jgi:hypothetical protein
MSWAKQIALRSAVLLAALTAVLGLALPSTGPASAASLPKIHGGYERRWLVERLARPSAYGVLRQLLLHQGSAVQVLHRQPRLRTRPVARGQLPS